MGSTSEGIQFMLLPDNATAVLTWYTYQDGQQLWLIGSGPISNGTATLDMVQTEGAQFGSAFRAQDVTRTPWGTVEFSVLDCNRVTLLVNPENPNFAAQTLALTRVLAADCGTLSASDSPSGAQLGYEFSGTYFDPLRDGEGFQVTIEEDGQTVVATWYTYLNGAPIWLIGSGTLNGPEVLLDMTITSGASYGPAFRPEDVQRENWGTVRLNFIDCNSLEVEASPTLTGFEPVRLSLQKVLPGVCR